MPLVSDSPALASWLKDELDGATCVVDLGAGFFDKLRFAPPMAKKIGVEVFPSYLGFAPPGVIARLGDIREWQKYVEANDRDTAMCIDAVEHMSKGDGSLFLRSLKEGFRKVLVMTPDGYVPQDEDVTGYENEWQIHECGWTQEDLEAEGFSVHRSENFHPHLEKDALFAVWERK
jgi:hypothetical protein